MANQNKKEQGWEKELEIKFNEMFNLVENHTGISERDNLKSFISAQISKSYEEGFIAGADSTGSQAVEILAIRLKEAREKSYQDGYAKGRIRCLEQHFSKKLDEIIDRAIDETLKHGVIMPKNELTQIIKNKLK